MAEPTRGWRSDSGVPRPDGLAAALSQPSLSGVLGRPAGVPLFHGTRPLKRWRYVAIFDAPLMLCAAEVRIGPARQTFWAIWDGSELRERTRTLGRHGAVRLERGRLVVVDGDVGIDAELDEDPGVETICGDAGHPVWTRKQGGIAARGRVRLGDRERRIEGRSVIDDTAGYHERRTAWRWCAGIGRARDGTELAWNLVAGVNDPPRGSERTAWVAGVPRELAPVRFADDLSGVEFGDGTGLRFASAAVRRRRENLLLVRSDYVQPFGSFSGALPGPIELAVGEGVMECHEARW